jgi:hypothetical protein
MRKILLVLFLLLIHCHLVFGQCDQLDLAGIYGALSSNTNELDIGTDDWSASAWVRTPFTGNAHTILNKNGFNNDSYDFFIQSPGKIGMWMSDAAGDVYWKVGASNIFDGSWHHVAVTVDRNVGATIWLDGDDDNGTPTGTIGDVGDVSPSVNVGFGQESDGSNKFEQNIMDVRIWIGGLWSEAEIDFQAANYRNYGASSGTFTEAWACDEGAGTTLNGENSSVDLTLSNALAWADDTCPPAPPSSGQIISIAISD